MGQERAVGNKINLENMAKNHAGVYYTLLELLEGTYQDIVELDLETEMIFVLRNQDEPEQVGNSYPYAQEADVFRNTKIMMEDMDKAKELLSIESMRTFYESNKKRKSAKLRARGERLGYEWVEISISSLKNFQEKGRKILITIRNINDQMLMKSIIDNFVYSTCDYFIHLDINANSYVTFSGTSDGTPLPPSIGEDYSDEIVKYAREFVVEEDQDYVIEQMRLEVVQKALDEHGEHVFYCGVNDPNRGYTRKCLKYLYYDKENKMVLLIRTDVTGVYILEQHKNAQLRLALLEARTDSLTGIYNRKAAETLIREAISGCRDDETGAFIFIDVDNFKQVNDKLGHAKGDFVLKFFAEKLKKMVTAHCIVGRVGGDEFVAFCPKLPAGHDLNQVANQLCCVFDDICDSTIEEIGISCSIGVALFPQHGKTYSELYEHADQALYVSKGAKKQHTIFDCKMAGQDGKTVE